MAEDKEKIPFDKMNFEQCLELALNTDHHNENLRCIVERMMEIGTKEEWDSVLKSTIELLGKIVKNEIDEEELPRIKRYLHMMMPFLAIIEKR